MSSLPASSMYPSQISSIARSIANLLRSPKDVIAVAGLSACRFDLLLRLCDSADLTMIVTLFFLATHLAMPRRGNALFDAMEATDLQQRVLELSTGATKDSVKCETGFSLWNCSRVMLSPVSRA